MFQGSLPVSRSGPTFFGALRRPSPHSKTVLSAFSLSSVRSPVLSDLDLEVHVCQRQVHCRSTVGTSDCDAVWTWGLSCRQAQPPEAEKEAVCIVNSDLGWCGCFGGSACMFMHFPQCAHWCPKRPPPTQAEQGGVMCVVSPHLSAPAPLNPAAAVVLGKPSRLAME